MKIINGKLLFHTLVLTAVTGLTGCSVWTDAHTQKQEMMACYMRGENDAVQQKITEELEYTSDSGDELMWQLEAGSFYFHIGNYQQSIGHFTRAEKLIEDYDFRAVVSARDAAAESGALLTNLNALPYRGLCRDRVAIAFYKALAYLGDGREDAFRAQLKRLRNEQKKVQDDYQKFFENENADIAQLRKSNPQVEQKYKEFDSDDLAANGGNAAFKTNFEQARKVAHRGYGNFLNPVCTYLSALGSLLDGNYDNARIDLQRLYTAMPENPLTRRYYVTALKLSNREIPEALQQVKPFDFPLDKNSLYVIGSLGRSATFKEISVSFPVMAAWPGCEFYEADFTGCTVKTAQKDYLLWPLADMDGIIAQEFEQRLPGIIARTVLITAIKEAIRYGATAALAQQDQALAAGVFLATSIYNAAVNTADTRSWEILPREFIFTQLPMPQDRKLEIVLNGKSEQQITLELPPEAECNSAIVLISAPSRSNIHCHILPINSR